MIDRIPDHCVWGHADHTVYLLHGGYGSMEYWGPEVKALLDQGHRVIAWDTPGYGLSPLPAGEYSIESMAESFITLLNVTGSPGNRNILLGHSMGGLIAPKVTAMVPDRIAALIISATVESLGHTSPDYQSQFLTERIAPLDAGMTLREAAPALINAMMGPDSEGEAVELVKRVTADTPDDTFRAAIKAIVEYDGRPVLAELSVPTLCIAGEHDPVGRPDMMREIASNIQGAEFYCVNGAAHYAWAEYPDDFNSCLFAFLEGVIPR